MEEKSQDMREVLQPTAVAEQLKKHGWSASHTLLRFRMLLSHQEPSEGFVDNTITVQLKLPRLLL